LLLIGGHVEKAKLVVLGGGMVAGYMAKQLVELGLTAGELAIVSADDEVPYERPPLSKGFLAGKDTDETVRINPAEFYREHGIDLRLHCEIESVDLDAKRLRMKEGGQLGFEKLVVATGARVRRLDVPGAELEGVLYLRSMDDSRRIREHAGSAKRAVVVGGGFIGMEVAAVLSQKGIETTMILRSGRIGDQLFTPEMSHFFETYYTARGVRFERNATIESFGGDGVINSVRMPGGHAIPADMVVAGIGVQPVTEFLASSGIELSDGIVVNEYLETNRADVYAAGDVANYKDVLFGKRRRVEHWDNAVSQGQYCARLMMGDRQPFRHVPYFFSDIFDLSYEFWGDTSRADQVVVRGDMSTNSFSVWWLRGQQLVAAFVMNRPDDERTAAPQWIESKRAVSTRELRDTTMLHSDAG
jgi:NADPH-dependent 2,4-dienoyl-CoA reductase/sulfur reductase-like enzyme